MSTPEGWDQIKPEMLESAQELRKVYVALLAAGFTTFEAAIIIGGMIATGNAVTSGGSE